MADADKKENEEEEEPDPLTGDDWIRQVVENLPRPPGSVVVLWGYLGDADVAPPNENKRAREAPKPDENGEDDEKSPASYRLYTSPMLNEYMEIQRKDVIYSKHIGTDTIPLGGTYLWVKPTAMIQYVRTETLQVRAGFLQGPIMSGWGMGMGMGYGLSPLGQMGGGGLTIACNGGGLTIACNGGGLTIACNGGGLTIACNGGGLTIACNGGGLTIACNGGAASFVCR